MARRQLLFCAVLSFGCHEAAQSTQDLAGVSDDLTQSAHDLGGHSDAASTGGDLAQAPSDLAGSAPPVDPITITQNANESGFVGDAFAWIDNYDLPRSMLLTYNDRKDAVGHWGGVMRRMTYEHGGTTRACVGNLDAHPGFGKLINHYASTSTGSNVKGAFTRVLAGKHHAIFEYTWTINFGGPTAAATVHWFVANGRSNPVYAVSYDTTAAGKNVINADSRSPYGDLQWDYGNDADVDGVGWGDHYRFRTTGDPYCAKTSGSACACDGSGVCWTWPGWDYSQPTTVPHALEWSNAVDAEMGIVQTQTRMQHDGGGYWFYGHWGMTDVDGPMPEDYNWAYQLNQYELPFNGGIKSKRLAWGTNFGAVGQDHYNAIGDEAGTLSGYPYQSYSTYVVLGAHSDLAVDAEVAEVETVQQTTLTTTVGTVKTSGPAGLGRLDTITYAPPGRDPIYGTWNVVAATDAATFTVAVASGSLPRPVFVVEGFGAASVAVELDGTKLTADADFLATIDADHDRVWLTLRRTLTGTHTIAITP